MFDNNAPYHRQHGRLKLYIGFAAGVGKTCRMLEEAHALQERGIDVVLAFIETHGREETVAKLEGLERIPRRVEKYHGVQIDDMDLDAVLKRKPEVAIVDELAHTNIPGSKHMRRYEDVLALLDAGIHVIGAFNIQHLESLNDLVQRAVGVAIRETIPDSFIKRADEIVNLDLAVEDLLERLRSGKIYSIDKIDLALTHFFKEEQLETLRELALREVAESLERSGAKKHATDANHTDIDCAITDKLMVCMTSYPPRAAEMLRRGSRLAGRLNTNWYVVYVETPKEAPHLIDAETQRHLLSNIAMAKDLGADVVTIKAHDPAEALLHFARTHGVAHVLLGRSNAPWWKLWFGKDLTQRLLRMAVDLDIHIVAFKKSESRS